MSGPDKADTENKAQQQQTMEPNGGRNMTLAAAATTIATEQHDTCAKATTTSTRTTTTPTATSTPPSVIAKKQSDFIFGRCIGEGSFSTVYLGTDKHTRREYAIKVCDKRHILREHKQEYVRREREVLQIMTNVPGFVKLMCTFQDSRSLYFVMTYAPNGELLPHIKRVGCFSVECARHYAAELVLACEQMHRRRVVHRDLKPENILLDKHMHTLIADFGSAKVLTSEDIAAAAKFESEKFSNEWPTSTASLEKAAQQDFLDDDDNKDDDGDERSGGDDDDVLAANDELDAFYRPQRSQRNKRKRSFVGTAQYVSPEVLQNEPISAAADLWALGCILYQMISGLPPFRGYNDFAVFKEILACKIDFPENFDKSAEDLVRQLLKIKSQERLGAQDNYYDGCGYVSIRKHSFFDGIDFETIRERKPPKIFPYLPCLSKEEEQHFKSQDDSTTTTTTTDDALECELQRILNLSTIDLREHRFDLTAEEKQRLFEQQKTDKWQPFADSEVILKKGFVHKHKGLFASKRMFLLTTGPHLIYVDPVEMIKSGEIRWGPELRAEIGNDRVFFIHTAERSHFFEALESSAPEWVSAIDKVHRLTYKEDTQVELKVE